MISDVHSRSKSARLLIPLAASLRVCLLLLVAFFLVLMCAGIAIRQWSVALLGEFFTIDVRVHRDQTVVERGPYRWVRHPSYTGLIMTFVGQQLRYATSLTRVCRYKQLGSAPIILTFVPTFKSYRQFSLARGSRRRPSQ